MTGSNLSSMMEWWSGTRLGGRNESGESGYERVGTGFFRLLME
ncbi:hypothetical protein [uncultured Mobiluncus sp.]|nr:hypothetical protein [uncultured Mobiluncus sp.]